MKTDDLAGSDQLPAYVLSLEEAEERLNPYKELLNECIRYGWDAYMQDYERKHHILCARTRAGIVFDEICNRAEVVFCAMPEVRFVRRNNSFMLYIGDDLVLRFKKLKRDNRCSAIKTKQQLLFEAQMCLPGVLAGTLVHAGYLLDDLQREIVKTLVVCQFKNRVLWTIKLTGEGAEVIIVPPAEDHGEPGVAAQWEFTGDKAEAAEVAEEAAENHKPE